LMTEFGAGASKVPRAAWETLYRIQNYAE
jgi:hypothetical protein